MLTFRLNLGTISIELAFDLIELTVAVTFDLQL